MAMDDKSTILYYSKNTLNILYIWDNAKKQERKKPWPWNGPGVEICKIGTKKTQLSKLKAVDIRYDKKSN